jgi:hypothetical protein
MKHRAFNEVGRLSFSWCAHASITILVNGLLAIGVAFGADYGPNTCIEGYVWRGAFSNDYVCLTPEVRDQAAADNRNAPLRAKSWLTDVRGVPSRVCRPGFVWRAAAPNDQVCVTAATRAQALADNQQAASRRKYPLCEYYANLAVQQNQTNVTKACGLTGARWHSNYDTHFRWCLSVEKSASDSEIRTRSNEIGPCLSRGPSGSGSQPVVGVTLQFGTGDLASRNLVITGSGFNANEQVVVNLTTLRWNQNASTGQSTTTANGLGQIHTTIGVQCPLGVSTTHSVSATGLTSGKSSNVAGGSC